MMQMQLHDAMLAWQEHGVIAYEHYKSDRLTLAQEHWQSAAFILEDIYLEIEENAPDEMLRYILNNLGAARNGIGRVYQRQGKLAEALDNLEIAYKISISLAPRSTETAICINNIGSIYEEQGKLTEALDSLLKAYEIDHDINPRSRETARDLNNIGAIYKDQGKLTEALDSLLKAYEIDHDINPRSADITRDLSNISIVCTRLGRVTEALEKNLEAYDIDYDINPQSRDTARDLNDIGASYLIQGKLAEALDSLLKAHEIDREIEPRSRDTVRDLYNIGAVYFRQDKLTEAIKKWQEAVTIVEGLRRIAGGFRGADSIISENALAYQGWIEALFARNLSDDHRTAFHVAERYRARTLAERMTERAVRPAAQNPEQEALLQQAEALRFALAAALNQTARARLTQDASALAEAERQVQQIESAQERNEDALRRVFPEYAGLAYPEPITLGEVQATLLDPGTLLLAYLQSGDDLYLWAVRPNDYRMLRLPGDRAALNQDLVAAIGRFHGRAIPREEADAALERLSRTLLKLVPEVLWKDVTRLLVIQSDILNYLPFEMLSRNDAPLGVTYEVSYAPSATVLRTLRNLWDKRPAPDWQREFLGIGDPEMPGEKWGSEDPDRSLVRAGAGRLPGTRYEVETIAKQFGTRGLPRLGPEATEWNVFNAAPKTRYVQFATHGFFDGDEPLNSFLLLSPPQAEDPQGHDNRLCVHEMFGLALQAELVVCSACVTGLSQERAGQGLVGMNTALLTAGAKCVLTTLWPVNDATMAEFMIRLYKCLQAETPVGKALQETRKEMRAVYSDAYHWAPVIAMGLT